MTDCPTCGTWLSVFGAFRVTCDDCGRDQCSRCMVHGYEICSCIECGGSIRKG